MTAQSERASSRPTLRDAIRSGVAQFVELNGQEPERLSGVRRTDEGWSVLVDVLDLERVPATTSILSTYRVDIDESGELLGYERLRRFTRSSTDAN